MKNPISLAELQRLYFKNRIETLTDFKDQNSDPELDLVFDLLMKEEQSNEEQMLKQFLPDQPEIPGQA